MNKEYPILTWNRLQLAVVFHGFVLYNLHKVFHLQKTIQHYSYNSAALIYGLQEMWYLKLFFCRNIKYGHLHSGLLIKYSVSTISFSQKNHFYSFQCIYIVSIPNTHNTSKAGVTNTAPAGALSPEGTLSVTAEQVLKIPIVNR